MLTSTRTYDTLNRLDVIANTAGSGVVLSAHDYVYDAAHRRTAARLSDGSSWFYGYNERDEITSAVKRTSGNEAFAGLGFGYAYDGIGNLTSDGRWNFTWNGENQLVEALTTEGAVAVGAPKERLTFTYDAQGRRIQRTQETWNATGNNWNSANVRRYVYDGWNCVAVLDGAGALQEAYLWGTDLGGNVQGTAAGPDQSAGGVGGLLAAWLPSGGASGSMTPVFYGYDGNGNVTGLVDAVSGQIAAEYDYTAFGEMALKAGTGLQNRNPYRFSTKPIDPELGWYYHGFRYYDPTTGRWTSRDPIEEEGGINLYSFIGNETVNFIDKLGLIPGPFSSEWEAAESAGRTYIELEHKKARESLPTKTRYIPREWGGRICVRANSGTGGRDVSYTAVQGSTKGVFVPDMQKCETLGNGWCERAFWHTHPGEFSRDGKYDPGDWFSGSQGTGHAVYHPKTGVKVRDATRGDTDLVDNNPVHNPAPPVPTIMIRLIDDSYEVWAYTGNGEYFIKPGQDSKNYFK